MPRILPRLLDNISRQQTESWLPFSLPRQRRKSLHKPPLPRTSFHPSHHTRSILLVDAFPNPITSSRDYVQHKSLPPRVHVAKRAKVRHGEYDRPRQMSDEERAWWASPYLRMLASPMRKCTVTNRHLPSDFLIRLGPMRVRSSVSDSLPESPCYSKRNGTSVLAPQKTFIPDGLLHPKFTGRRSGKAVYILCSKHAVDSKRVLNGVSMHSLLTEQIGHHLRLRVLQELELLADHLEFCVRRGAVSGSRVIRRLTREEWEFTRTTGVVPHANAVAVLVVPPLNRDPVTKERPEGKLSTLPTAEEVARVRGFTRPPIKTPFPLSTLHPISVPFPDSALDGTFPQAQTPFYNGVTMFPAREQRAALYDLLVRLLDIEQRTRYRQEGGRDGDGIAVGSGRERQKASHAFLLCSDGETAKRGDVAAIAIALWRVRMFEVDSWEEESANNNGWLLNPYLP